MSKSKLELIFENDLRRLKDRPDCCREFRFHKTRRWKFDFAWPEALIAFEIEGGTETLGWMKTKSGRTVPKQSRHLTPKGFKEDAIKYNTAAEMGWRVFRFTPSMVNSGDAFAVAQRVIPIRKSLTPKSIPEALPNKRTILFATT